ncbi:MAG: hypothetical protein ACLQIK_07335 [Mycobacterium sp.]|uniref:hypothetical protein n=1 Tax=Mycobacterium sp. TaxID=1785 RepID=UPI003F976168
MPEKECPGWEQPTGGESHNADSSEASREAAALAAARAETTRIKNQALDDVLAHLLKHHELSEQARELIAGLIGRWGP